jgi:ribosome-binding factor A
MGSEPEKAATFQGLASTAGYLRSRVGRALRRRLAPEIIFREDDSIARAARIESLLAEIRAEVPRADSPSPESTPGVVDDPVDDDRSS